MPSTDSKATNIIAEICMILRMRFLIHCYLNSPPSQIRTNPARISDKKKMDDKNNIGEHHDLNTSFIETVHDNVNCPSISRQTS